METAACLAPADPEEGLAARRRIGVLAVVDEETAEALGEEGGARLDRLALDGRAKFIFGEPMKPATNWLAGLS
jgi:hypothetical protein